MPSDIWVGKSEPLDFVTCRVCGFKATTLATHLRKHGLTADAYREKFPGALIRCEALTDKRQGAAKKGHVESPRKGLKKVIECPSCGEPREVGFTFAPSTHDARCPECRLKDEEAEWASKTEGLDYVICQGQGCGYRAENLTSHVQNSHPEWVGCYPTQMVATKSAVRDKSALKGKALSYDTKAKMSANAGRWNKGLTKETDERVARMANRPDGFISWSKGQNKETSDALRRRGKALSGTRAIKHWTSNEVVLTRDQLLPYALKNGKISVGRAIAALGHAFVTIRRECEKHGLPISHTAISEAICLEIVAQVLGEAEYLTEWNDGTFIHPKTGGRFRFDGFFVVSKLLVEFQGSQHYDPSSKWFFEGGGTYEELVERDQEKARQVKAGGQFKLFLVREDEPYADPAYLRGRLIDEGILDPGK